MNEDLYITPDLIIIAHLVNETKTPIKFKHTRRISYAVFDKALVQNALEAYDNDALVKVKSLHETYKAIKFQMMSERDLSNMGGK